MHLRFALIGILFLGPAMPAAAADDAERARIEKGFAEKLQADQAKAIDETIAGRVKELVMDGALQVLGNSSGDITIIEFFDYQCPYTKAVEPRLEKFLRTDGHVKLVVKSFPILGPASRLAARAAMAAARQDKGQLFHEALLAHEGGLSRDLIFEIAAKAGLDTEKLSRDMDAPEIADAVMANFNQARSLKVTSTPTFIIDGHLVAEPSAKIDFERAAAAVRAKAK